EYSPGSPDHLSILPLPLPLSLPFTLPAFALPLPALSDLFLSLPWPWSGCGAGGSTAGGAGAGAVSIVCVVAWVARSSLLLFPLRWPLSVGPAVTAAALTGDAGSGAGGDAGTLTGFGKLRSTVLGRTTRVGAR